MEMKIIFSGSCVFQVTNGVPEDVGLPFSDISVPAVDGFIGSPGLCCAEVPWHGDHSLLLGLISMYYIIFFFWIHLFNAMSRFRAWSLKLPTIACSAPGFVSSCSEQEFLRLREDSNTGSGEQGRSQWGLETNCLWETSLVFDVIHLVI